MTFCKDSCSLHTVGGFSGQAQLNSSVENIGARRLQTVMEKVLEELSFNAADRSGDTITIDADYVRENVGDLAKNTDLSRYIL